jgi:hypothetical protein
LKCTRKHWGYFRFWVNLGRQQRALHRLDHFHRANRLWPLQRTLVYPLLI